MAILCLCSTFLFFFVKDPTIVVEEKKDLELEDLKENAMEVEKKKDDILEPLEEAKSVIKLAFTNKKIRWLLP